jgi:hypothetical protein
VSARIVADNGIRQRARMDAHRLFGHYAPENINLNLNNDVSEHSEEDQAILEEAAELIARRRLEQIRQEATVVQTDASESDVNKEGDATTE